MNCDVKTWHTRYLICDPCGVTPHRLRTAAVSRHKPSPFLSCFWPWPWSQQQNEARPPYNNQSPKWSWLVFTEQSCSGVVSWVRLLPRELTDAVRAVFGALTKAALCLVLICSCLFMWRAVVFLGVTPVIFVVFRFVPWFENIVECDPPCWAAAVLSSCCAEQPLSSWDQLYLPTVHHNGAGRFFIFPPGSRGQGSHRNATWVLATVSEQ